MLNTSPNVELLCLRNREMVIVFLVQTFINKLVAISSENIHIQLVDFLEDKQVENDEESEISAFDTYEDKAKIHSTLDKQRLLNPDYYLRCYFVVTAKLVTSIWMVDRQNVMVKIIEELLTQIWANIFILLGFILMSFISAGSIRRSLQTLCSTKVQLQSLTP